MSAASHPSTDKLFAFLQGRLSGAEADAVAEHLASCPACSATTLPPDDALIRLARRVGLADAPAAASPTPEAEGLRSVLPPTDVYAPSVPITEPGAGVGPGLAAHANVPGYEILGELGRGGMGVVYKARQEGLDRLVALKMLLGGAHAGPERRARFLIEAQAIARLQHPNIVQIHEIGERNGLPFFSLEFCPGGSLEKKLGKPLPPAEAARLAEVVAQAVQAAHDAGIIHRDLKPANVLLARGAGGSPAVLPGAGAPPAPREEYVPKVTDFGLAKDEGAAKLTETGAQMGTPSYMAPEQAAGKKEVGPSADVYALGAILYECLTGRPPFKAATGYETMAQVLHDEPAPPRSLHSQVPRDLETICLKCLEKDPHCRYGSAGELAADLRRWREGEPILARPVGPWGRMRRWAWRQPALASTLAGLTVFYLNHLLCLAVFEVAGATRNFTAFVTAVVVAWGLGAFFFQRLVQRPRWTEWGTFAWASMDVVLFTLLLGRANGPRSPLVVGYLLLAGGAALRGRPALVWFVTGLSLAGYAGLTLDAGLRRPEMMVPHYHSFIFVVSLGLMGLILHLMLQHRRDPSAS